MNIKLPLAAVNSIVDKKIPLEQLTRKVQPVAEKAGFLLPTLTAGSGYLQWDLPGTGWLSFNDLPLDLKDAAAIEYQERKAALQTAFQGSQIGEVVLTIPETKFAYFRQNGETWDVALVAWGHKYPDRPAGNELDTWIVKQKMQDVSVGFSWDGQRLPNMDFILNNQPRTTSEDGLFHVDEKLLVGRTFPVATKWGKVFTLVVTEGQSEYVYDLTQYFSVMLRVTKNDAPCSEYSCSMNFGDTARTLTMDSTGAASLRLAMVCDSQGQPSPIQPECVVTCNGETKQQAPQMEGDTLSFAFAFNDPKPNPPGDPEPPGGPEPPEKPEPPVEPKFFCIKLRDYQGFPLVDMPFTLTTKKKGQVELKTDDQGQCVVPKDWFTDKEKLNVKFTVTSEYQTTHDIHYNKKKKK